MKTFIFTLILSSIPFVDFSQGNAIASIDLVSNFQESQGKTPKTDSVLLKLKEINNNLENLKKTLIQQVIDSVSNLPNLVNENMQQQINDLNVQINDLTTKLNAANQSAKQATDEYNQLKTDSKSEYDKLKKEKEDIASNLATQISNKAAEWDLYIDNFLKTEKYLSEKDAQMLKKQAPKHSADIDSFLVNSKILEGIESFLYKGVGNFDELYKKYKTPINSKFKKQFEYQNSLKEINSLFIQYSTELSSFLNKIDKLSQDARKIELENWKQTKYVSFFPYLKLIIEKNYKNKTPLSISTTAP